MDFAAWFKTWLARHPLNAPTDLGRSSYTAEVMARVKALAEPAPAPAPARSWAAWPRWALTGAVAAAGMAIAFGVARSIRRDEPLARDPASTPQILRLAESSPSDESWVEETLQLLDQLDEDISEDASSDAAGADEEWLDELEMLDERDLAASS